MQLDFPLTRRVPFELARAIVRSSPTAALLVLLAAVAAGSAETHASVTAMGSGVTGVLASQPSAAASRAMFQRLRELAGGWRAVSDRGWSEVVTYEVIARGSVVMSTTTFRDAPDRKMVTMYHMDGDLLVATHYCEARNQPRLVAEEVDPEGGRAVFRFAGGGNLEDRDRGHMDTAVVRIVDDDHVLWRWTWYQDGSERWLEEIELVRVRAGSTAVPREAPGDLQADAPEARRPEPTRRR